MKGNDNLKKYLKRTEGISSRRVLMTALMALAVLVIGAVLGAYPYRFVLKYTHWPDYICLQLPDRSGNGTCLRGRRKMGRQPDQWFY